MRRKVTLDYAGDAISEVRRVLTPGADQGSRAVSGLFDSALSELERDGEWHGAWQRPPISSFAVLARPFAVLYVFYADSAVGRLVILHVGDAPIEVTRSVAPVPEPPDSAWDLAVERLSRGGW